MRCGATTIWERWDSYTKENGANVHGMNSFNHFAFGTCAEWFYEYVLGIKMRGESKELLISPIIDEPYPKGHRNLSRVFPKTFEKIRLD